MTSETLTQTAATRAPVGPAARRRALTVLALGAVVISIALGARQSFGLFLQPVGLELGVGREVFGFAIALQNLFWGLAQPFAGMIADRWGSGRVVCAGGLLYALGLWLAIQKHL